MRVDATKETFEEVTVSTLQAYMEKHPPARKSKER